MSINDIIKDYTSGASGVDVAHNNMPPYYALCYTMKV